MTASVDGKVPAPSNVPAASTTEPPQAETKALGKFNGRTVAEITDTTAGPSMVSKIVKFVKDEKASLTIGGLSAAFTVGALTIGFSALAIANPAVAIGVGVTAGLVASIALPILLLVGIEYILRQHSDDIGRGPIPDEIDEGKKDKTGQPKIEVKTENPDNDSDDVDLSLTSKKEPEEEEMEITSPHADEGGLADDLSEKRTKTPSDILARELEEEREKEAIIADSLKKTPPYSTVIPEATPTDATSLFDVEFDRNSEVSPQFSDLEQGSRTGRGKVFNGKSENRESPYSAHIDAYIQESKKNGSMGILLEAAKGMNTSIDALLSMLNDLVEETDNPVEINQKLRETLIKEHIFTQVASRSINQLNDALNEFDKKYPFPTQIPENDLKEVENRLHFLETNEIMNKDHPYVVFVRSSYLNRH